MNPDYEKKLRELEEWEQQRRAKEVQGKKLASAKTPNLERIPLGCVLWVAAAAIGIFYAFRGCAGIG